MAIHKGTELNNVKETWQQNEENDKRGAAGTQNSSGEATGVSNSLNQTIKEEAAEYDRANKEDRLLSGDRASVSDEEER